MSARTWTAEQRQQQREAIKQWKPWAKSTGPKSISGKAAVSRNAFSGGAQMNLRKLVKELNQALLEQRQLLR